MCNKINVVTDDISFLRQVGKQFLFVPFQQSRAAENDTSKSCFPASLHPLFKDMIPKFHQLFIFTLFTESNE